MKQVLKLKLEPSPYMSTWKITENHIRSTEGGYSMECLRCNTELKFLKEYRFDSQETNRGFLKAIFDVEEHLMFNVYVCPKCNHSEFLYSGSSTWIDM